MIKIDYTPIGIRLDSGDLAYLSKETRKLFITVSKLFNVKFEKLTIVASNDLSVKVIAALNEQSEFDLIECGLI